MAVIAYVNHGKSNLSDSFVAKAGIIDKKIMEMKYTWIPIIM